jgi:hypothetical protein
VSAVIRSECCLEPVSFTAVKAMTDIRRHRIQAGECRILCLQLQFHETAAKLQGICADLLARVVR